MKTLFGEDINLKIKPVIAVKKETVQSKNFKAPVPRKVKTESPKMKAMKKAYREKPHPSGWL